MFYTDIFMMTNFENALKIVRADILFKDGYNEILNLLHSGLKQFSHFFNILERGRERERERERVNTQYSIRTSDYHTIVSFLFVEGEFPGGGRANTESVDTLIISNWSAGDNLGFSLLRSKVKVQTQLYPTLMNTEQYNKDTLMSPVPRLPGLVFPW